MVSCELNALKPRKFSALQVSVRRHQTFSLPDPKDTVQRMPKKQLTENYKFWGREGSLWYFFTYFEVSVTKNDLRNAFFSEFWL